jgi:hypothetical protein
MDQDGDEEMPLAYIDLSFRLANIDLNMPAPEVTEERNIGATKDAAKHNADGDAGKVLWEDNTDANEDLNKFLELSLQTQTTISFDRSNKSQDEDDGGAHVIDGSNMAQDGDKSGAQLIEGINRGQGRDKVGTHLIGASSMAQDRDGSGAHVIGEEKRAPLPALSDIDLDLCLGNTDHNLLSAHIDLNMPAPEVAEEHDIVAVKVAAENNADADKEASEDNMDIVIEETLEDETDVNVEISENNTDATGDSMVLQTDASDETMEQYTSISEGTVDQEMAEPEETVEQITAASYTDSNRPC